MRHTAYRVFLSTQYEKEEKWLNEISARGMGLVMPGVCKYTFEDQLPGEYTYKIELLGRSPRSVEGKSYLKFLEETGIEHIGSVLHWIYLRKRTEDGPFALYSDMKSTIKYFQRLRNFFIWLTILEFVVGIFNILIGLFEHTIMQPVNLIMGLFLIFLGILLAAAAWTHAGTVRKLRSESRIRE